MAAEIAAYYSLLLPLLLVVVPALYLVVGVFRSRRRSAGEQRFPPGPWALPVIGHLHHLAGSSVPPHHAMRDLARRYGPLMLLKFCQLPVLVATSPDAAREIMKTHDVAFASRPLSPTMQLFLRGSEGLVFAPYGDGWRQLRKICTLELLSNRRVHSFRAVRAEVLGRLLRSVASSASASASVNLTRGLASFVADSSVQAMIGRLRSDDRDTLFTLLREGFKVVPGMTLPDLFPTSRLAMLLSRVPARIDHRNKRMAAFMDSVIQQHREKRSADGGEEHTEDLLDVLLRLQDDMGSQYPLTTENIKLVIILRRSWQDLQRHLHGYVWEAHRKTFHPWPEPSAAFFFADVFPFFDPAALGSFDGAAAAQDGAGATPPVGVVIRGGKKRLRARPTVGGAPAAPALAALGFSASAEAGRGCTAGVSGVPVCASMVAGALAPARAVRRRKKEESSRARSSLSRAEVSAPNYQRGIRRWTRNNHARYKELGVRSDPLSRAVYLESPLPRAPHSSAGHSSSPPPTPRARRRRRTAPMDARAGTPLTSLYSRDPSPAAAGGNPSAGSGGLATAGASPSIGLARSLFLPHFELDWMNLWA
ncbi:Premnaspirodiene oxygenase [Hordeum vulgare]|nr:Premnaspirodiene oxygenase [Hordeum vulgare]